MRNLCGPPKNVGIVLVVLIISLLAGCTSPNTLETNNIPSDIHTESDNIKDNEMNKTEPDKVYDYAKDNPSSKTSKDYHSGILAKDVDLSKPYNYKGNVINGDGDIPIVVEDETPQPSESINPDDDTYEPAETLEPPEETDNTEPETDIVEPTPSPDMELELGTMQAALDIQDIIIRGTVNNGVSLLSGAESEDRFNESHDISMLQSIKSLKSNLERLEYCDALISEYFSNDTSLINSWQIIKADMTRIRAELAEVNTAEDYIKADINLGNEALGEISGFTSSVQSHQIDTSKGGEQT